MLLDHDKFVGLLVENSGIEKEKVEKYLAELIADIKKALAEDEAYEVDGFGVFSKLGNNVFFIPSEELETEINYKYVGMEPLELPGLPAEEQEEPAEENPIAGILDAGAAEEQDDDDPFAAILGDTTEEEHSGEMDEAEEAPQEEQPDLVDESEIEAAVEEEIDEETVEDIFNEISGDIETEEDLIQEDAPEESAEEPKEEQAEESAPGPEQWGIDAHKEEDSEDAFAGLLGDTAETEEPEEESHDEPEEDLDFSALSDSDEEDFDDPFAELPEDDDDFVPVVTNVSSGKTSKPADEEPEESTEKESKDKEKKKAKPPRERQSSPVLLYLVLFLVIALSGGYLAAYFGLVTVEGITPPKYQPQAVQTNPQPVQQPVTTPPPVEVPDENNVANQETETPQQQEVEDPPVNTEPINDPEPGDIAPPRADEKAPGDGGIISPVNIQAGAEDYGLTGTATEAGNNGYTIVLYTLSRKAGADTQFEKLSKDGYRVIIKEKPSEQYGVLYRVSIGQFETLADAAIAAERIDPEILGNYIITKI